MSLGYGLNWVCLTTLFICMCVYAQNDTAKPGEPVKTPVKEDESLDIQNSLIPKHENNTASADDPEEVNSLMNTV